MTRRAEIRALLADAHDAYLKGFEWQNRGRDLEEAANALRVLEFGVPIAVASS